MRIVIATMKHETNTFSPVPTGLDRFSSFGTGGPSYGDDVIRAVADTNTVIAGFMDVARDAGAEIITPMAAAGLPSGPVEADAYNHMCETIIAAVGKGCEALFLDLHGAMVSRVTDDGEGTLLERVRAVAPDLPIAVGLDLHTNLTQRMVDNCTLMVGYKTYPHVDMRETGRHAARLLVSALKGDIRPVMAWGNRPLLPHTLCMGTDASPMKDLIDLARGAEAEGALAATVFGGFPLADMAEAGLSAVVVGDGDVEAARRHCDRLLDAAWDRRAALAYETEPLADSVARAKAFEEGPVLLIDHADNTASGGTQDTMAVVREIMRQGLEDVAVFAIVDPGAVAEMISAGVGATLTVSLGGKMDMPAIGLKGEPLDVTGTVRAITDGTFTVRGPMYTGMRAKMGRCAVLDTGPVRIAVIERHHEPWDLGAFRSLGIEPTETKFLMLKSRIHYRAGFLPIARHIVECGGVGVTSSDNALFPFRKLRRPIYPFDADARP